MKDTIILNALRIIEDRACGSLNPDAYEDLIIKLKDVKALWDDWDPNRDQELLKSELGS